MSWLDTADARYQRNVANLTALTGAAGSALASLATQGKTAFRVTVAHEASGADLEYVLRAGTDAENVPWVIRPDDFDASTNAQVWELVRVLKDTAECAWEATNSKFHQIVAELSGGSVSEAIDQTGFQITA